MIVLPYYPIVQLPLSAFGDMRSVVLTPVVGWTFHYNINADLINTTSTGSGTNTQNNGMVVLQTGETPNSSAKVETIKALRYTPGLGGLIRFTAVFTSGVVNSTQIIGIGDDSDGFFFGFNGDSFGILRRNNLVDTWISQKIWNVDKLDGTGSSGVTLDVTKGNVYTIQYQWLGFGNISFYIENPNTGLPTLVHEIQYANANTAPSILNPTLPLMAEVINTTNNTNITLQSSSAMAFIEGDGYSSAVVTRNSISNTKIAITQETSILTIRNKPIFQSKTNRIRILLDQISFNTDGTRETILRLVKNATLGGTPAFTDISPVTSVIEYDTAGTTVTDGIAILTFTLGRVDSGIQLLDTLGLELGPGEFLTLSAQSENATNVSISIGWKELF